MKTEKIVTINEVESKILLIRDKKVMLDRDLAEIYSVETKNLNRAVKRNIKRFPLEFMFQLTKDEKNELVTNWHRFNSLKHSTSFPFVFTEHGAVMLASVLNSPKAVEASIFVVKAFIKLREVLSTHKELAEKLKELEQKHVTHDTQILAIFDALNNLLTPPEPPKKRIGFAVKEKKVEYKTK